MKSWIAIAFVCCLSVAIAQDKKICKTNADCDEGECCVRIHDFTDSTCKKLRQIDEFCFPNEEWNNMGDKYKFMCPCVSGLKCKAAEEKEEDGVITYVNARCVETS